MSKLFFKARARDKTRTSGGFTLIELLVVITIIVLLISFFLPAVANISNMGYRSSCFMNMSAIGRLNQQYASDNNGYVVPAICNAIDPTLVAPNNNVATSFDEYLREVSTATPYRSQAGASVYQCPAGPAGWLQMGNPYTLVNGIPALGGSCPLYPHDPDLPCQPTDGGNYAINIHQNSSNEPRWEGASWVPGVIFVNGVANSTNSNSVGLKTSQWQDPSGTILIFETWRDGGWRSPSCAGDVTWDGGPMLAAFNGSNTKGLAPASFQQAITLWQEKHLGKANLLFCDGHGDFKFIGDTLGTGETIKTQGITYNTVPTMNSCYTVRGMWTNASGD